MGGNGRVGIVATLAALTSLGGWVWPAAPAHGATLSATLIRMTASSAFDPPSPDPSGITYLPGSGRLLISDGEVEEMSIYAGENLFEVSRMGSLAPAPRRPTPGDRSASG